MENKLTTQIELNSLQKAFQEFINQTKFSTGRSPDTIRGYTTVFELFSKIMPEVSTPESLSTQMMTEFFKRIRTRERVVGKIIKRGVRNSTIRTYWWKLDPFLKWMVERGLIFKNPLEGKPPRVTYEDRRALDHESIKKIISAISLHSSNALILKRDTAMVYLLSFTGIRLGEFISLEASDVDMKNRILRIRGETSKSKIARQIPIQDILFLHLEEYIKERNKRGYTTYHFFVSSHGDWGLTRHGLKNWVKSLIKKSGVKFHLHRFRHTFATDLAENDTNLFKVQKLLGHKDIRMTMVYVRSMKPEDLREDVNKLTLR